MTTRLTMTGTSTGSSWAIWFCHRCHWTGALYMPGDAPHVCKDLRRADLRTMDDDDPRTH